MNKKILSLVEERLLVGERKYGNENVISDGRDFTQEALEESLDLAVYVAAKLIEIKQKENKMGRAIDMENDISILKREMKELQGVVAELSEALISTKQLHHVDLTEGVTSETATTVIKGTTLEPDEEYTAPVGKRKKTKKTKTATVG